MHIRALVLGCVTALAMMAFAPVAMADPAPDICVLNLSQPVTVDHAVGIADAACAIRVATEVASVVPISPDGEDEPIAACAPMSRANVDFATYRQHVDPGRCSA